MRVIFERIPADYGSISGFLFNVAEAGHSGAWKLPRSGMERKEFEGG